VRKDDSGVQVVPTVHVKEDVQMEDGEVSFPPLPTPVPPMAEAIRAPHFQRGANWTPVPIPRGALVARGSPFGRPMPRYAGLVIASVEELEQHLEAANTPRNELAVAHMHAYVREANMTPEELRSLVQNTALAKWKIPVWVLPPKVGNPNAFAGVNMPRHSDSPEEWARWLWRYPREAFTRPGIHRGGDGISLTSVRGMLLVTGRAPCGMGMARVRNAFILRAAQLVVTPGLYRRLVAELRLSIVMEVRVTVPAPSENISVEDVARLFAADGVTIPQVLDAYEWGNSVLQSMSSGVDASRRMEAMTALAEAKCRTSSEEQDCPRFLEPRWWYPSSTAERQGRVRPPPQTQPVPAPAQVEMVCQRETPLVVPPPLPQPLMVRLPARGPAPSSSQPTVQLRIDDDLDGWSGMQVHYLHPKKKKKKKKL
jgi:hypothetical protein